MGLIINQKDARNLCQVGRMAFPLFHGAGMDVFVLAGDVGGNAKPGLGTAILQNIFHHFIISVRRLDEDLRLMLGVGTLLQLLQFLGAFGRLDGQIAVEGKALSVEARCHD